MEVSVAYCVFGLDLETALEKSAHFLKQGYHVATMPEITTWRATPGTGEFPWENYFTTSSIEYFGLSADGRFILAFCHGIGPIPSVEKADYLYHHGTETNGRWDGMVVPRQYLLDLESGKYGEIVTVDYNEYSKLYKYPFIEVLRASQAMLDPVALGRMGRSTEDCIEKHRQYSHRVHEREDREYVSDPFVIEVGDNSNMNYGICKYEHAFPFQEKAIAHMISTGRLMNTHFSESRYPEMILDVGLHARGNAVRLLLVRDGTVPGTVIELKD